MQYINIYELSKQLEISIIQRIHGQKMEDRDDVYTYKIKPYNIPQWNNETIKIEVLTLEIEYGLIE